MKRIPLIIDTDPGHDDAIAIMTLLASPELVNILGIVTVAGNQTIDKVTANLLKVMELTGSQIPVARGAAGPLKRKLHTGEIGHGDSGMDGPDLPVPERGPDSQDGLLFTRRLIMESREKVTILAIGPLTNIALLLTTYPEVKNRIQRISFMGGGLTHGNITPAAEFNIYVDPEAAALVFNSGIPLTMSGLDVTDKAQIYKEEWAPLHQKGKASRFTAELLDFYNIASRKFGYTGSSLHDSCAAVRLIAPDLFTGEKMAVDVETEGTLTRGMTVADRRRRPEKPANIEVLLHVEREKFITLILNSLERLDRMIEKKFLA